MSLLEVNNLSVAFDTDMGQLEVLDRISLQLDEGQTLGLVGESGCGKSVTALSIMGLLPQPSGKITGGEIVFRGQTLNTMAPEQRQALRGNRIAMIFQETMTALNPVHQIGKQLMEVYALHFPEQSKRTAYANAISLLTEVGIPAPEQRMNEYPHQLSGGMRQRVMIAIALACRPDILIADEPTTALDVTIQAQILDLMTRLQEDSGMAILFITHDLGVIAQLCNDAAVMYAGRIAEHATVTELFRRPAHPYTRGLLSSIPTLDGIAKTRLNTIAGNVPALQELPSGCRFRNRCDHARDLCANDIPQLSPCLEQEQEHGQDQGEHQVACLRWQEI